MGIKYESKDKGFDEMNVHVETLNGRSVEVGAIGGEHAWLAGIHEYGCNIPVTEKMRGYLASKGLYLKKSTKTIHIPERAFLRTGYDTNKDEVLQKADALVPEVVEGDMDAQQFLDAIGLELSSKIKDYTRETKADSQFTIDQKGSSTPLSDTGELVNGITWRVD